MNKIAPQDMRLHLMLNQSRLSTAEEVAQEIEDHWDATEEFSRDDKNQAGFIAPVGKGPAEGGKPNGVPYNSGKGSGTESLVDTVIDVGESATKKHGDGLTKST